MNAPSALVDGALEIETAGERLWLLPERAAYWPRRETLLIADAHLGKAAAFRRAGIAVPAGTTQENLVRLTRLVETINARVIVFLGDLLHSAAARRAVAAPFARWRQQHRALQLVLVRGNHDRHAGDPPVEWGVECVDEPHVLDAIALCHVPRRFPGCFAIGGHTHPAARLTGAAREHLRLPCFFFSAGYAILPAFGSFTGMADVEPAAGDRVYVVAGERVVSMMNDE